jgi:hypothetical protein
MVMTETNEKSGNHWPTSCCIRTLMLRWLRVMQDGRLIHGIWVFVNDFKRRGLQLFTLKVRT